MTKWFRQLDEILRGDATRLGALSEGEIKTPVAGLIVIVLLLSVVYGVCMGSFAVIRTGGSAYLQMLASGVKLPLLFVLTMLVTTPSLYVFNALVGSRLSLRSMCRLLVAMLGVVTAVLASLGPIVVFFGVSTTSYPFMKLLNVVMCAIAGALGLAFLLRTLHRLVLNGLAQAEMLSEADTPTTSSLVAAPDPAASTPPTTPATPATDAPAAADAAASPPAAAQSTAPEAASSPAEPKAGPAPTAPHPVAKAAASKREAATPKASSTTPSSSQRSALDRVGDRTDQKAAIVFRIWVLVFSIVGAQMAWVLRPFIGNPALDFAWLRSRESNFFLDVLEALTALFGG